MSDDATAALSKKSAPSHSNGLEKLKAVVHDLRSPRGCPWDQEQTHESLVSNMIEEAYEAVEAIQSGDKEHLREELGDVLLQVVLHAEIASEIDAFDLDAVAHEVSEKLIRRHPHVYGSSDTDTSEAVLAQWDAIKRAEKGDRKEPYLARVGTGLPALSQAAKIQKKAAKIGFDWPDTQGPMEKIREETEEVSHELEGTDAARLSEEIGDLLFAVVNLARKSGIDPEAALASCNQKFVRRFGKVESALEAEQISLDEASLGQMEAAWQHAKAADGNSA
jgi:ATP diphosphatase